MDYAIFREEKRAQNMFNRATKIQKANEKKSMTGNLT